MNAADRTVRVAVVGYGVIGKRVADAVAQQPDMRLAGIADVQSDWRITAAMQRGHPLFAGNDEALGRMRDKGLPVQGGLAPLLQQVDVVVDCTPGKVAAGNVEHYRRAGLRFVLRGGERHEAAGHSFVAEANYASAVGRPSTRVVSCNTTSIVRTLGCLRAAGLLRSARGTLMRRATDPVDSLSPRSRSPAASRCCGPPTDSARSTSSRNGSRIWAGRARTCTRRGSGKTW